MRHSNGMLRRTAREDRRTVNAHGTATLLVAQPGSEMADALAEGLRAAGRPVTVVTNPLDSVAEAVRADPPLNCLVVGVDFFDDEAFRLLPLFRREWPDTTIVAYHGRGFEHKGRIAGLVGADVVLSRPAHLLEFLGGRKAAGRTVPQNGPSQPTTQEAPAPARVTERSARTPASPVAAPEPPSAAPAPSAAQETTPPPAPPAAPEPQPSAPAPEPPPSAEAALSGPPSRETADGGSPAAPTRQARPARKGPPAPPPAPAPEAPDGEASATSDPDATPFAPPPAGETDPPDDDQALTGGQVIGTVELTDEELRILLGEDDDT